MVSFHSMKKITLILVLLAISSTLWGASARTNAVDHWAGYFGLDRRLVLSIMEIESRGRWWAVSTNDRAVLTEREWPYEIIDRFKLDATRPEIWASYGVMQVNYLVALDLGFRGTVDELRGTWTNVKYGCRRLWQIREDLVQHEYEFNYSAWIWHYNQSWEYVGAVLRVYRRNLR